MPTFDLLREPWIPVVTRSGDRQELSLTEVLSQAPRLAEIRDENPLVEFGLYRLLTALVTDLYRLQAEHNLTDLLDRGAFDPARLADYFGTHGGRFDLFHPQHPFLQDASLADAERKPVALLHPGIPSGTNANHFHHREEDDFAIGPAVAARLLTTVAPFMTMGGAGLSPSINGAPPWYALLQRPTLFETLCLNACTLQGPHVAELGVPAWRRPEPMQGKRQSATLLEALTWQPRRILLDPDESGGRCSITGRESPLVVRTMRFTAGATVDFPWWDDPNVAYKAGKDTMIPLRPLEGRQVWRDTGALVLNRGSGSDQQDHRPGVVRQFAALFSEGAFDGSQDGGQFSLSLYGMRTDLKTKVFEWQRERLVLPRQVLTWGDELVHRAQQAMDEANAISSIVRSAIRLAYPREGKGARSPLESRAAEARERFWSSLAPRYQAFLHHLAALPPGAPESETLAALAAWREALLGTGRDALNHAIEDLDADRKALERQVNARDFFYRKAYPIVYPDRAPRAGPAKKGATAP